MIHLPLNDGMYIRDYINKYRRRFNIPEPEELKKIYNKNTDFLDDELQLVKHLRITKELLPYLQYFENLNSIIISGNSSLTQNEIQNIINMYPNLKDLRIEHQSELQYLDLSNQSQIQDLEILSNDHLHNVVGIDKMNDLYGFTFYDNQLYNDNPRKDIIKKVYKISHDLGAKCNIDVLYIPEFIEYLNAEGKKYRRCKRLHSLE